MKTRLAMKLIAPLVWLLLLCSSQIRVEAQDTINPKLLLDKTEIDICKDGVEKDFVLSIDLGKPIYKTDSLFVAVIIIAYKKNKVMIDGHLKLGTLFEQFNIDYVFFNKFDGGEDDEYSYAMLQGMNVTQAVSGDMKLAHFTGKLLTDAVECFDFKIDELDLGKDFKYDYPKYNVDSTTICLINKNLPDRKISFVNIENSYTIDSLNDTLKLDYIVNINNIKNLKSFNVELSIDDNVSTENIKFANIHTNSIIEKLTDTHCIIKVDNIIEPNIDVLTAEIVRKKDEKSDNVIHCEINGINESACSMNGESQDIEIKIDEKTSILGELNDNILILDNENNIILKSNEEIKLCKLVDIYGLEVNDRMSRVGEREVLFDKTKLAKGIYFVRVLTNNKTKFWQNIKLIIN